MPEKQDINPGKAGQHRTALQLTKRRHILRRPKRLRAIQRLFSYNPEGFSRHRTNYCRGGVEEALMRNAELNADQNISHRRRFARYINTATYLEIVLLSVANLLGSNNAQNKHSSVYLGLPVSISEFHRTRLSR